MAPADDIIKALKEEGGCGLIVYAVGIAMMVGFIYLLVSGGDPKVAKFRKECLDRETRKYLPGDVPDFAMPYIAMQCEREVRARLGLPP